MVMGYLVVIFIHVQYVFWGRKVLTLGQTQINPPLWESIISFIPSKFYKNRNSIVKPMEVVLCI